MFFTSYQQQKLTDHLSTSNMGKQPFFSFSFSSLCIVLLASTCFAISSQRLNECQLPSLEALEPDQRVKADAGLIETWNSQHPQLRCAGGTVSKRTLYRNALHLPSYSPYPQLIFIDQGKGVLGLLIPGCPRTYEQPSEQSRNRERLEPQDRHQKIRQFKQGDVLLIPPGVPYWTYNTGDEPLVSISLLDTSNDHNQLDQTPREFYLGGNPELEHPETVERQPQPRRSIERRQGQHHQGEQDQSEGGSILSGFSKHFLAQSFNTSEEIAQKLQSSENNQIVRVEGGLSIISPKWQQQQDQYEDEDEEEYEEPQRPRPSHGRDEDEDQDEDERQGRTRGGGNGIEENICSLKLQENIVRPSRANFYNPRAGRIMNLNSLTLPALRRYDLSAQYVVLYKNGIYSPHWNLNANSIIIGTRGQGRVRVVDCQGNSVFDGELRRGQLLVVPQNFVVAEQAGEQGFEYIVFKTQHNAITSYMKDLFRALPLDVLSHSYNLRSNQAYQLKLNGNWGPLVNPVSKQRNQY